MNDHHRVGLPWVAGVLVPNATPEIDDLLTVVVRATRAAKLTASREVVSERVAHPLETTINGAVDKM
jgi:hypothetical protein